MKLLRVLEILTWRKRDLCCNDKRHTAINSVHYQWVRRGLSQFAEGTATHCQVMGAGEECSHCRNCNPEALWGRTGGMTRHLWTERWGGEPGSVGSVIKVNGSGTLIVVTKHYNHNSTVLKNWNTSHLHYRNKAEFLAQKLSINQS